MFANPKRARLTRLSRRPIRAVCLDLAHTDPDSPCTYCDATDDSDTVVHGLALRRHAELAAEDAELAGWAA
jgi:hypothetical protein